MSVPLCVRLNSLHSNSLVNLEEITGGITLPCELYEKDQYIILQFRSSLVQVTELYLLLLLKQHQKNIDI
jgi:hypothetical protein